MDKIIDLVPKMTSNTSLVGVVSASSAYNNCDPYLLFDKDNNNTDGHRFTTNANCPQWIQFKFNQPTLVNLYSLRAESTIWKNKIGSGLPKTWKFMGSNTGNFDGEEKILDTITNFIVPINITDTYFFNCKNYNKYLYYRLTWTDLDRTDSYKNWTIINEFGLYNSIKTLYLIKQLDKYYSIKSDYYSDSDDKYNSPIIQDLKLDDFESYGIYDLSSIHNNALNKLIDNKYNIAMLK